MVLIGVLHQVTGHVSVHAPLVKGKQVAGVPKHLFVRLVERWLCVGGEEGRGDEMGRVMREQA